MDFKLHPRLSVDTIALARTDLSEVLLMNDAAWPWVILVPRRSGVREIYELTPEDQLQFLKESSALGRGMMMAFGGDKLNVAALGNVVPQLHLHHIVRFEDDPAWPAPVWGYQAAVPYTPEQLRQRLIALEGVLERVRAAG